MIQKTPAVLHGISSMATKVLLADLCGRYAADRGIEISIEAAGGVDAAKRVQAGEAFDLVLLAADAILRLLDAGHLLSGSRCDWVDSPVAVAVPSHVPPPDIRTEAQLRTAVLAAASLSYSTGPSGVYLEQLFQRWGVMDELKPRILVPPPGTPVGLLVAGGKAALGFQQRSELMHQPGIMVIGDLPREVACITTFSAGIGAEAAHDDVRRQAAHSFIQFLASPEQRDCKRSHGMDWSGDDRSRPGSKFVC
ncbi:MAG: ABC transporter substrate-binding protein [Limnohabitans sp.]|nr:ABC transporter substrate-binding protein [Limnohabitans sp.]